MILFAEFEDSCESSKNTNEFDTGTIDIEGEPIDEQVYPKPDMSSNELLRQPFLLDSDICVEHWLEMSDIKIHDFVRFQVGDFGEESEN